MREVIGNTTATPNPRPDWSQTDASKANYILNKPNIVPMFIGTTEQYEEADAKGQIAVGTIVFIIDNNSAGTTSVLGEAVLGYMILG